MAIAEKKGPVVCPDCASPRIRRSSSYPLHLLRVLSGSKKRWCLQCGRKWHLSAGMSLPTVPLMEQPWFILAVSVSAGVAVAILAQGLIRKTQPDWVGRKILMRKANRPLPR